ncbi:MAG: trypsin-like peptidase domain-containing protein [Pseudomonadota bacterium]
MAGFILLIDEFRSSSPPAERVAREPSQPISYAQAVKRAAPAVVSVRAMSAQRGSNNALTNDPLFRDFFDLPGPNEHSVRESSLGSGVAISTSGTILTNYHVIHEAQYILISTEDGQTAQARILGVDPETDLAVLQADIEVPVIGIGDSDAMQVGDIVLAIGSPLGIGQTVTQGIISATGRKRVGVNTFEDFIQTDAAINPGNSGGALVNVDGELVGINTFRARTDGIGFAIPTNVAIHVANQLIVDGEVTRGWLGIEARDLTPNIRRFLQTDLQNGVLVLAVLNRGPADRAGIQPGDVLVEIDGDLIVDSRDAIDRIAALKPGESVTVKGWRRGAAYELSATVIRRPTAQ